jgi:uncharacterized protein YjdB
LSPKTSTAVAGTASNRQLTASIAPADATDKTVKFSIAPTIAGLTISSTGNITWTADVPAGTYTATVTTSTGNKKDTHVLALTEQE